MLRARAGDRQAFASLVARCHREVFGYFVRIAGDRDLAEDLTQECFLRLLRGAAHYSPGRPFRPWLYGVAANLWRDHWRRISRKRETTAAAASADAPDPTPSVEERVEGRMLADRLGVAVRRLPPETAQVIVLRFCHDLRVREIAETLGLPEGTVKSRLFYGLRRLRDSLDYEEACGLEQTTSAARP